MTLFWASVLAISILLYVLLDGFDLGVGMLFGLAPEEQRRRAMMSAVAPIWDGNETWLVVTGVVLWGAFPLVYAIIALRVLSAGSADAGRADPARRGVRIPAAGPRGCAGFGTRASQADRSSPPSCRV